MLLIRGCIAQPQTAEVCASMDCGRDLYKINGKLISVIEDLLEFERELPYSTICFMQKRADAVYVLCVGFDSVIPTSLITPVHYILR
jgi:hypothetical protein